MEKKTHKKLIYTVYNIETDEIKIFDHYLKVCKYLGIGKTRLSEKINDSQLVNDKYIVYTSDQIKTVVQKRGVSEFLPLPKRYVQKILHDEKVYIKDKITAELKKQYSQLFKDLKVYVFNDNLQIIDCLSTLKTVSEYFNIPEGTVKSRLHRIREKSSKDYVRKYKMCSLKDFDQIFKTTV